MIQQKHFLAVPQFIYESRNEDVPTRSPQSLAKLTVNFQSSLLICDSAGEVANSTGPAGDSCNLQLYCDTGCQTDIMGEVGDAATPRRHLGNRPFSTRFSSSDTTTLTWFLEVQSGSLRRVSIVLSFLER